MNQSFSPTVAIIGAGNMGASLIAGLIQNGHLADKIWAADPSQEKIAQLKQSYPIHVTTNNIEAAQAANVVIFCVKPQLFEQIAVALKTVVQQHKPLIISIAAGVREAKLAHWLGDNLPIVRAMPNTPAMLGCGATALHANTNVNAIQHNAAESILRAVGIVVWLNDEKLMDTVTALSGSGPAYFFLMMEALQQAAESLGLPSDIAKLLTLQTALGASRMALESDESLSALRQHVTSPGGTTEKAIDVLEKNHLRELFKKAVQAAKLRSEELG